MILSACIQKGGVGKSTSIIAISSFLALRGYKVLCIDFDSQANTTVVLLGNEPDVSLKEVIMDSKPLSDVIFSTKIDRLNIIPSNISLAKLERYLIMEPEGIYSLRDAVEDSSLVSQYDYILIDTPPSLGMLTINALVASDFLIIPVTCSKFSIKGLQDLEESITYVQKRSNPGLKVLGAFINQYDARRNVIRGLEKDIVDYFGDLLFETRVRANTRIEEAMVMKQPIFLYDSKSIGAKDFSDLCKSILIKFEKFKMS
jgi:chromosome partitioning protein